MGYWGLGGKNFKMVNIAETKLKIPTIMEEKYTKEESNDKDYTQY